LVKMWVPIILVVPADLVCLRHLKTIEVTI